MQKLQWIAISIDLDKNPYNHWLHHGHQGSHLPKKLKGCESVKMHQHLKFEGKGTQEATRKCLIHY